MLFPVTSEFESQADSLWTVFPVILVGKDHPLLMREFSQLQYSMSFSILPFPEKFKYKSLDELFHGFPNLLGAKCVVLFVSFRGPDPYAGAPYDENEVVCSIL